MVPLVAQQICGVAVRYVAPDEVYLRDSCLLAELVWGQAENDLLIETEHIVGLEPNFKGGSGWVEASRHCCIVDRYSHCLSLVCSYEPFSLAILGNLNVASLTLNAIRSRGAQIAVVRTRLARA